MDATVLLMHFTKVMVLLVNEVTTMHKSFGDKIRKKSQQILLFEQQII